jgi:DNA-binding NarL/FixJ family response regulator
MSEKNTVVVVRAGKSSATAPLLPPTAALRVLADLRFSDQALAELTEFAPQVLVLDLRGLLAAEVGPIVRRLRTASPRSRIVAIGDSGSEIIAQQAIVSGVASFQSRDVTPASVLNAVTHAASGEMHLTRTGRQAVRSLLGGKPGEPPKK